MWESGGEVLIENPPDYGAFGLWATNPRTGQRDEANPYAQQRLQPRHAPIWMMPWMRAFLRATGCTLMDFAECTWYCRLTHITGNEVI